MDLTGAPPPPPRPDPTIDDPAPPSRRVRFRWPALVAVTAAGCLMNASLQGPPGLGIAITISAIAAAIAVLERPRPGSLILLLAAVLVASGAMLRASSLLIATDVVAALALLCLGASFARSGDPVTSSTRAYVARAGAVLGSVPEGAAAVTLPVWDRIHGPGANPRAITRAAVLIVPVVGVLVVLLSSADPVFAHYLSTPISAAPTSIPAHAFRIAVGVFVGSALLMRARRPVEASATATAAGRPRFRGTEWTMLLVAVAIVFAAFVFAQMTAFFGGRDRILTEAGLTYAEYARSGFWQLLGAAILSGAVIAAAWHSGARSRTPRERWVFVATGVTLVILTLVVLASAFRRLSLYEGAYGFTWPRLVVHAAILMLGALLGLGVIALVTGRASWLPTAALAIAVIALGALHAIDAERFIADRNVARYEATGQLDMDEIGSLSADAVPGVVGALPGLDGCERVAAIEFLAAQQRALAVTGGWSSWNLSRARARTALAVAGIGSDDVVEARRNAGTRCP